MWKLGHKEGWEPKNWCFQTVVTEKNLESPLDCKEIKSVNPKGNQPWIFIGKIDVEAPIVWLPDAKGKLIGKDPEIGEDRRQKEKRVAEDEMARQHHQHNGLEFERTPGDGEGREAWRSAAVHGVAKSLTWLRGWTTATVAKAKVPFASRLSCYLWRPGQVSSCCKTIGFYTCGLCLQHTETLICMDTL